MANIFTEKITLPHMGLLPQIFVLGFSFVYHFLFPVGAFVYFFDGGFSHLFSFTFSGVLYFLRDFLIFCAGFSIQNEKSIQWLDHSAIISFPDYEFYKSEPFTSFYGTHANSLTGSTFFFRSTLYLHSKNLFHIFASIILPGQWLDVYAIILYRI